MIDIKLRKEDAVDGMYTPDDVAYHRWKVTGYMLVKGWFKPYYVFFTGICRQQIVEKMFNFVKKNKEIEYYRIDSITLADF